MPRLTPEENKIRINKVGEVIEKYFPDLDPFDLDLFLSENDDRIDTMFIDWLDENPNTGESEYINSDETVIFL